VEQKVNPVRDKSKAFALRCVKLYEYLISEKKEYVLSKQLLRSGTSIGANISEAIYAQSNADFASKMAIACKEASESEYWIELLRDANILNIEQAESLLKDCNELISLLVSIRKSITAKIHNS
jgi:four helix bundle protein